MFVFGEEILVAEALVVKPLSAHIAELVRMRVCVCVCACARACMCAGAAATAAAISAPCRLAPLVVVCLLF